MLRSGRRAQSIRSTQRASCSCRIQRSKASPRRSHHSKGTGTWKRSTTKSLSMKYQVFTFQTCWASSKEIMWNCESIGNKKSSKWLTLECRCRCLAAPMYPPMSSSSARSPPLQTRRPFNALEGHRIILLIIISDIRKSSLYFLTFLAVIEWIDVNMTSAKVNSDSGDIVDSLSGLGATLVQKQNASDDD